MTTNPFEDETASYRVLKNDEGQYSLWPARIPTPGGWHVELDDSSRDACLRHIETHWTDMRPASLVTAMDERPSR